MTGDQSRALGGGGHVCWGATTTDLGTVVGTAWNGVTIDWDDGRTTSIQHNDTARVKRVPTKWSEGILAHFRKATTAESPFHFRLPLPAQSLVAQHLQSFQQFPPR